MMDKLLLVASGTKKKQQTLKGNKKKEPLE
jgi:hypothetical protein